MSTAFLFFVSWTQVLLFCTAATGSGARGKKKSRSCQFPLEAKLECQSWRVNLSFPAWKLANKSETIGWINTGSLTSLQDRNEPSCLFFYLSAAWWESMSYSGEMMWLHFFGHFGHVDLFIFIVTAFTNFSVLVVSFIPVCSYSENGIYTQREKPGDSCAFLYLMKVTAVLLAPMPWIFVFFCSTDRGSFQIKGPLRCKACLALLNANILLQTCLYRQRQNFVPSFI